MATWRKMKQDEGDEDDFVDGGGLKESQFEMGSHFLELLNN